MCSHLGCKYAHHRSILFCVLTSDGPAATRQLGNGSKRDAARRTLNQLAKGERRYSRAVKLVPPLDLNVTWLSRLWR